MLFINKGSIIFPLVLVAAGVVLLLLANKKKKERVSLQAELEIIRRAEVKHKNDYDNWNDWIRTSE